jgi:signal transduction histidine kinase
VGLALIVAAVAMVLLLRRSLRADVEAAALVRAEEVGGALENVDGSVPVRDLEDEFVQVIGPGGEVIAASANVTGQPPLAMPEPGETLDLHTSFEDDPFIAVAWRADPNLVVVGRTIEGLEESTATVTGLLAIGAPLLLLFVGGVTWLVVGRALAPVESIRLEVDSISSSELHRRVPEPPTGDEVSRLARTMNRMLIRLQEGQARQRRFVSDASHELRSPIASIRQHSEVALAHPNETDPAHFAEVIRDENHRMQRLVEDLLLLARMDEGAGPGRNVVDLDDLVFEEVARVRGFTAKGLDVTRVSAGRVSGDRRMLGSLVGNLIENAVRHAATGVRIALEERDDRVIFTVDDDGDGIPVPDRERVFQRFVRLQEARDRDSGGSGLGLAIVAEVAVSHGGSATIDEAPGGGTRVVVSLPRAQG